MFGLLIGFAAMATAAFLGQNQKELSQTEVKGPLTLDFNRWLKEHRYGRYNFPRLDLGEAGSYGGKLNKVDQINQYPVIFIHGNSDGALDNGTPYGTGWTKSIKYFLSQGYTSAELYATTWGDRVAANGPNRTHNCRDLLYLRAFIQAVLEYTEADRVNIISHSMGVTMARPIIKGLKVQDINGVVCNLGPSLGSKIYTFIGIAGGNYGLCLCASAATETWEGCNTVNGFAPGTCRSANATCTVDPENCQVNNYASLLDKANKNLIREGRKTYAIWSTKDEIITNKNLVFGRYTSSFPTMDNHIEFHDYNHMDTKDKTVQQQYEWVQH